MGFIGDITEKKIIDWKLILLFTFASIAGIFIGNFLSKKVEDQKMRIGFGWFVLCMGIYIISRELFWS